jgi:hypothetical protein
MEDGRCFQNLYQETCRDVVAKQAAILGEVQGVIGKYDLPSDIYSAITEDITSYALSQNRDLLSKLIGLKEPLLKCIDVMGSLNEAVVEEAVKARMKKNKPEKKGRRALVQSTDGAPTDGTPSNFGQSTDQDSEAQYRYPAADEYKNDSVMFLCADLRAISSGGYASHNIMKMYSG